MLSDLRRLIGAIDIEEKDDDIIISGIPTQVLQNNIKRIWRTSRINRYLFRNVSRSSITIPRFFAVEFDYLITELLSHTKRTVSKNTLKRIRELLYEKTWLQQTIVEQDTTFDRRALRLFHKTPLDYQEQFFSMVDRLVPRYRLQGFMLAAPPGTGKTLATLMIAEMRRSKIIIVICMKNAISDPWVKTFNEEYTKSPGVVWSTQQKDRPQRGTRVFIAHYEAIDKLIPHIQSVTDQKVTIILDESHHLNEIQSKRTQNFIELVDQFTNDKLTLWTSGTPLKAIGAEMIPFLRTIDSMFSQDVRERFKQIFGQNSDRATQILKHRLGLASYRIDKSKVVSGEPIHETIYARFDGSEQYTLEAVGQDMADYIEQRLDYYRRHRDYYRNQFDQAIRVYQSTLRDEKSRKEFDEYYRMVLFLAKQTDYRMYSDEMAFCNRYEKQNIIPMLSGEQKTNFRDAVSVIKYVELKVRGEALGRILGRRRQHMAQAMIPHLGLDAIVDTGEKKTLLFTSYVSAVDDAVAYFEQKGLSPLRIHGKTTGDLDGLLKRFSDQVEANPAVATYQSLGTAIPILAASQVILLNQPFREYIRDQAISRVDRRGQDAQVYVYHCVLDTGDQPNLSSRSVDIVEWSKQQVDAILGTDVDDEQLSIEDFATSEQLIQRCHQPITFEWGETSCNNSSLL